MVERFNVGEDPEHPSFSAMHPAPDGHWCRYLDYEKLDAEFNDLVIALEDISGSPYEPSAEDARQALRRLEKKGWL